MATRIDSVRVGLTNTYKMNPELEEPLTEGEQLERGIGINLKEPGFPIQKQG